MTNRTTRVLLGMMAVLGALGCGSGSSTPEGCQPVADATCPSPAPSYATDVAPVLMRRCRPCHTAGGAEETAPFDTYAQVDSRSNEMQVRVQGCLMPPADQPQLTASERTALLGWLACGAKNN